MKKIMNNPTLTGKAREMRKNMTSAERHLWYDFLKDLPQTVNRKKVIGTYILDFYCASSKIAIDITGTTVDLPKGQSLYPERDVFLSTLGIKVLSYSAHAVHHYFEHVCDDISLHLNPQPPQAVPLLPKGEG